MKEAGGIHRRESVVKVAAKPWDDDCAPAHMWSSADERLQARNNALTISNPEINFGIATVDPWSTICMDKAIVALHRRVDR